MPQTVRMRLQDFDEAQSHVGGLVDPFITALMPWTVCPFSGVLDDLVLNHSPLHDEVQRLEYVGQSRGRKQRFAVGFGLGRQGGGKQLFNICQRHRRQLHVSQMGNDVQFGVPPVCPSNGVRYRLGVQPCMPLINPLRNRQGALCGLVGLDGERHPAPLVKTA